MTTKFETAKQPLLSRKHFMQRVMKNFLWAIVVTSISLGIGILGYCYFGDLGFYDGLLNASMILTGMGPVNAMPTNAGKVFASFYALFSGVAYLTMTALLLGPVFHRFLHKFHLEEE